MQDTINPGLRTRGYFGIGVEGVSKSANVGALLRTAHAFGAAFCFTAVLDFDARAARTADTSDIQGHVPLWRFDGLTRCHYPRDAYWWEWNYCPDAADLPSFRHPAERRRCSGPRAVRPVAGDVGAMPPRGAHPHQVRPGTLPWPAHWCWTTACCSMAASPTGRRQRRRGSAPAAPCPRQSGFPPHAASLDAAER